MWATKVHRRLGTMSLRMTCVISFYYGNSHTHCGKSSAPSLQRRFIQRRFYTQTFLQADIFTHRHFHTETLLHAQKLLHTDTLTHRPFYTHIVLHTDAFTHKGLYTQKLLHTDTFTDRHFCTQTLLHTGTFTRRSFYTKTLFHTEAFTHRLLYTQTLLWTKPVTHRRFYRPTLLEHIPTRTWNRSETSWLRSANLSAQHSADHIPLIWFTSRPKTSIKNPGRYQTGARVTSGNCRLHDHA